jgi:hypothetical protein
MAKQVINVGTPDQGNGDPLRRAFVKVNYNFDELYTLVSQINASIQNVRIDGGAASTVYEASGLNIDGGKSNTTF